MSPLDPLDFHLEFYMTFHVAFRAVILDLTGDYCTKREGILRFQYIIIQYVFTVLYL